MMRSNSIRWWHPSALAQLRKMVKPSAFAITMVVGSAGCTTGPMNISETQYFMVADAKHANFYRMRVEGRTRLGVAEYRSGWFPARSVDSLFGDVSAEGSTRAIQTRSQIEAMVDQGVLQTTSNYLARAGNPDTSEEELSRLNEARRRVLRYPLPSNAGANEETVEIGYDPTRGIVSLHADEKLVLILSSNPDEVVGKIANFAESEQNAATIAKLTDSIRAKATAELQAKEALEPLRANAARQILRQIDLALEAIPDQQTSNRTAIEQIEALLQLLASLQ